MTIADISAAGGEWLKGTGREADIVISSRIRLARNLSGYPFSNRASDAQRKEVLEAVFEAVGKRSLGVEMTSANLEDLLETDRRLLVERHLVSRELVEGSGPRGVSFGKGEMVSIMVNEEDHVRIQVIQAGFELDRAWEVVNSVDDSLERSLNFAFSPRYGYLTACPTNVGTGMRVSVMLHLPGLVMTRELEKVFNAVFKIDLVVRGLYGEGTQASGDFYQISNQRTLGKSEDELLVNMKSVIPQISSYERRVREMLLKESGAEVEDQVWRAFGILKTARIISSEETMHLLSQLRMGVNLGVIKGVDIPTINQLFILTQPAHLVKLKGRELDEEQRNVARAEFLRQRLGDSLSQREA